MKPKTNPKPKTQTQTDDEGLTKTNKTVSSAPCKNTRQEVGGLMSFKDVEENKHSEYLFPPHL